MNTQNPLTVGDIRLPTSLLVSRDSQGVYARRVNFPARVDNMETVGDLVRNRVEERDLIEFNNGLGRRKARALLDWLESLGVYPYREATQEDVLILLEGKIGSPSRVLELVHEKGLDPVSLSHIEGLFDSLAVQACRGYGRAPEDCEWIETGNFYLGVSNGRVWGWWEIPGPEDVLFNQASLYEGFIG